MYSFSETVSETPGTSDSSIRAVDAPGLKEKKRGVWYRKSKAFLHFHEDPAGIFADLKHDDGIFHRFPVNTAKQQARFLKTLRDLAAC